MIFINAEASLISTYLLMMLIFYIDTEILQSLENTLTLSLKM